MTTSDHGSTPPADPGVPAPLVSPAVPRRRFPSWKQALVTFFGGLVLAATACVGFLISLGGNFERGGDAVQTPIAAILFFIGLVACIAGVVFLIIRMVRAAREKNDDSAVADRPDQQP